MQPTWSGVVDSTREPTWTVVTALAIGFCSWFGIQAVYGAGRAAQFAATHRNNPAAFTIANFTAADWAFLSTVPGIIGLIVLLVADQAFAGRGLIHRLGLSPGKIIAGVGKGLIAAAVVIPPTYLVSYLTEIAYQFIHYQHPQEHELLKVMADPAATHFRWILIVAATVVAPLFEESLFRVHLQTVFARLLTVLTSPMPAGDFGVGARGFTVHPAAVPPAAVGDTRAASLLPLPPILPVTILTAPVNGSEPSTTAKIGSNSTEINLRPATGDAVMLRWSETPADADLSSVRRPKLATASAEADPTDPLTHVLGEPTAHPVAIATVEKVLPYMPAAVPPKVEHVWQTWAAIIMTSILFSMVHPMWMWPTIFFLSVGLGYCYERTGNAWSNITIHCVFNSISTFLFFAMHK